MVTRWKMLSVTAESQYVTHVCPTSEDVFVVPEIVAKTPRKILGPCTASSTENQQNMGPLTTPTKGMEVASGEPWTPTSNLKMLISAASPDIRNREKELCNDNDGEETLEPSQDTETGEETEKLSRKEKSLGLLCHKFLARYPDYPDPALNNGICLDDVATELNVERRRIYDIMNVLESLHMVSRSAKNRYIWRGRSKLTQTLAILRQVGKQQRYAQQMQHIRLLQSLDKAFNLDGDDKENEEADADADAEGAGELGQKEMFFVELPGVEFKAASVNSRKDKSLRVMSQKFVMLFLVSSPPVVSLEVAAKILIGEDNAADQDKSKVKTKVRRLYDIANILRSLKLIEKVHVTTEEKGRKPAFEWIGPLEFPQVTESEVSAHACSAAATKRVLESRTSKENCAKNLFSSPRSKTSFTRHPSLMKLAKSIQEDRRKITSAPSSPVKDSLCDSRNSDFPSKMAQLAAICQIQRDLQSKAGDRSSKAAVAPEPVAAQTTGSQQEARVNNTNATHLTPQTPQPPAPPPPAGPGVSYIRAHCPPLIPMLLPQPGRGAGSYAVYLHPSSLRGHHHHHLAKPQPTSLAVRSMTFEDKSGQSPTGHSPAAAAGRPASRAPESSSPSAVKRPSSDPTADGSPSKAKRVEDASPKLCEILQARLAPRGHHHLSSRPSPRALHKDPEFLKAPGGAVAAGTALGANQTLEQSVETFLEKEDRAVSSDSEAGLTPLRAVPCTPSGHTETLVPAGYLFPISQQSLLGYKDLHALSGEGSRAPTPTYNIYHTPTAGSRPPLVQEVTPTGLRLHRFPAASPLSSQGQRLLSPSPAILNFTLQNLGLIQAPGPGQTPERATAAGTLASPLHPAHLGGLGRMVFIKPMSPVPIQQTVHGQPLTLISVQQSLMATPKGTGVSQPSFFHTPVSLSPLAAVVSTSSPTTTTSTTIYIPQRKLEVSPKGS